MPFKLFGIIILLILVTIFAGVNLENKCNISFVFYTFENIPVFMTAIISFAAGAILMLPFTFFRRKKKNPVKMAPQKQEQPKIEDDSKTLFDFKIKRETNNDDDSGKKGIFSFGKKKSSSKKKNSEEENNLAESTPANTDVKASGNEENSGAPV
jgi:uncharacterized integral membrane protein